MAGSPSPLWSKMMDAKSESSTLTDLRRSVRDKLRIGVYKLSKDLRSSRRSQVWGHFRMVLDEKGDQVGYAGCMYCLDVLKHEPHVSGTSSLFTHLRSCPAAFQGLHTTPADNIVSEVCVKEEVTEGEEPRDQEEWFLMSKITDVCADYVVSALLPCNVLHGEGFRRLAQLLVDCGAQHGKFDVKSVLPKQTAVVEWVFQRAAEERGRLRMKLEGAAGRCAALALQQLHPHLPLRALVLRSVKDWHIETDFLGVCMHRDANHDKVKERVFGILKKFELDISPESIPVVCGGEESGSWGGQAEALTCATHMITRTVMHLLHNDHPIMQNVRVNLEIYRKIIQMVNGTTIKLSKPLLKDGGGEGRAWGQTVCMVEGVCDLRSELRRKVQQKDLQRALEDKTLAVMEHLTALLKPFCSAVEDLESPDFATLHKVAPWLLHLKNSCAPSADGTEAKETMKALLREGLKAHIALKKLHRVAVFFNPRMNSLKILSTEEKKEVHEEVLRMAKSHASSITPPAKRVKANGNSPLAYLEDTDHNDLTAEREVQLYTIMNDHMDAENLLAWWERNAELLPLLSAAARRLLVVPASAAPSPYLSALADNILNLSSSQSVEQDTIDNLVFLHSRRLPEDV